ncbi:cadherin-like protein 26 [Arapaima gigas]
MKQREHELRCRPRVVSKAGGRRRDEVAVEPHLAHEREKRELLRRTKRRWVLSTIELVEEDKGPFPKEATRLFNDKGTDHMLKYFISGEGVTENPKGVFSINDTSGVVFVHKAIDREKNPTFHIKFDVVDRETNKILDKTLAFDVAVKDINDNPPIFQYSVLSVNVKEMTTAGDLPVRLLAFDADDQATANSKFTMRLVSQDPEYPQFGIKVLDPYVSQLTSTGCFNYDKTKQYKVLVEAKDHGSPPLSSTSTVLINILDGNNHAPVFTKKQYKTEVMEMAINQDILRLKVEDKDLPNTTASQAVFDIVEGNEDGHYEIKTDPKTNEGVLTVVKGKDYERTTVMKLRIEVKNVDPLVVCSPADPTGLNEVPPPNAVDVFVHVIDVNDAPEFKKSANDVYQAEESNPGVLLFTPEVTDAEGDSIRYVLAEDPAHWVKIDEKTGAVTTIQRMDRESPYVNNSIYTILIHAIDNGKPPATSTGTVYVHLDDINDNLPFLANNSVVLCGNKEKSVEVKARDKDKQPFAAPFFFSLRGEDTQLKNRWKLDPETGESAMLHSLKTLAYGNYMVPLTIQDQQGQRRDHDLEVVMCDCGDGAVCRRLASQSSALGAGGILALVAGLLLLLLPLLFCLFCECEGNKQQKFLYDDERNQTLIKYNQEGGGSDCKAHPALFLTPNSSRVTEDGTKNHAGAGAKVREATRPAVVSQGYETWRSQGKGTVSDARQTCCLLRKLWTVVKQSAYFQNETMRISKELSLGLERNVLGHLEKRLYEVDERQLQDREYNPYKYAYEGKGSSCRSLEQLSFENFGDNLDFLQDLDPKFSTLGGICRKAMSLKAKEAM